MVDTIGTRARQLDARSGALNDTRRSDNRNTQDLGGYNIQGVDIAFATTDTITSVAAAFPTDLAAGHVDSSVAGGLTQNSLKLLAHS